MIGNTKSDCITANNVFFIFSSAKTDEVLKAKVAKREEEARKKLEDGEFCIFESLSSVKD